MNGGAGEDVLIGGWTDYDAYNAPNLAALDAILAEWASGRDYKDRIANIKKGVPPGGTATGGTGQDWFFANPSKKPGDGGDTLTDEGDPDPRGASTTKEEVTDTAGW